MSATTVLWGVVVLVCAAVAARHAQALGAFAYVASLWVRGALRRREPDVRDAVRALMMRLAMAGLTSAGNETGGGFDVVASGPDGRAARFVLTGDGLRAGTAACTLTDDGAPGAPPEGVWSGDVSLGDVAAVAAWVGGAGPLPGAPG